MGITPHEVVLPTTFGNWIYKSNIPLKFVHIIHSLTKSDSSGKLYFRRGYGEPWERLTDNKYKMLNLILDSYRGSCLR